MGVLLMYQSSHLNGLYEAENKADFELISG